MTVSLCRIPEHCIKSMTHDMIHDSGSTVLSYIGLLHSLKQRIELTVQKRGNS